MPDKEEKSKRKQKQPKHHAAKNKVGVRLRRKKIFKAIIEGKTQKQAGVEAGFSSNTAQSQVSQILINPNIQTSFKALLDKIVSDDKLAQKYDSLLESKKVISAMVIGNEGMKDAGSMTKDFVEVDDCAVQLKCADSIAKLKGHLIDRSEHSGKDGGPILLSQMSDEEIDKRAREILNKRQ